MSFIRTSIFACALLMLPLLAFSCTDPQDSKKSADAGEHNEADAAPRADGGLESFGLCAAQSSGNAECEDGKPYYYYDDRLGRCVSFEWNDCTLGPASRVFGNADHCTSFCSERASFLAHCTTNDACPADMICQAGRCTHPCDAEADCVGLAHRADCGGDGYCGASCTVDRHCSTMGWALQCKEGRCLPFDCSVKRAASCADDPGTCTAAQIECQEGFAGGCADNAECAACPSTAVALSSTGQDCESSQRLACRYTAGRDLRCECIPTGQGRWSWQCSQILEP